MTKRSFATLGTLALLAAASAFGQQRIRVDIPFEFHLAGTVLPAGQYEVNVGAHNMQSLVSLDCSECRASAYATTFGIGGGADALTQGRLVFNKYGETYFLSQVWSPGYSQGRALNKSKTEDEIARVTMPTQTTRVILAMR
jgi:ribosomal protein L33